MGLTIFVDFVQISSQGPSLDNISASFTEMGSAFSVNLEDFTSLKEGVYWLVLNFLLGACVVWVFLFLFIICKCFNRESRYFCISTISSYAVVLLPVLGNMFYLPFIAIFTEVFLCYETIGDDKDDAFLGKDCYEWCWQGSHIIYLIAGAWALASYVPVAVYMRPKWQELQQDLNVFSSPKYLMYKSCFQLAAIISAKTLKKRFGLVHSGIFTALVIVNVVYVWKLRPFNYERFNLW